MTNSIDIHKRSLGVNFTDDQLATACVWAPLAKDINLTLQDNALTLPLTRDDAGYWRITTDQLKPGDQYKFILDTELECADPASLAQPEGIYGPSQAVNTTVFYWEDSCWINPPLDEYVIYDLDVHTFTTEGTLKAIVDKLGYLKRLGISSILIRPVTPFPDSANRYWNGAFLYTVQASYGGASCLQYLVNACHYEGIAVILDLSYNHVGQPGTFFSDFGSYPSKKSTHTHRKPLPSANKQAAHRRYVIENALMWFRDFHIDALRLDAFNTLPDSDQLVGEIRDYMNKLTRVTGHQYYLLVEHDSTLNLFTETVATGNTLRTPEPKESRNGETATSYDIGYKTDRHQFKTYREDLVYDQQFSSILQNLFERNTESIPSEQVILISRSPQQVGIQAKTTCSDLLIGEGLIDREMLKLMAGSLLVSPYVPTLFMGDEWGAANPFGELLQRESNPVSFTNQGKNGVELSATLPKEMPGQALDTNLYTYYQTVSALRRHQPALYHQNRQQAEIVQPTDGQTLILHRWYQANHVLCLMNFSSESQSITLPSLNKTWKKVLDSADPMWRGPGASPGVLADAVSIRLQPASIVVYNG